MSGNKPLACSHATLHESITDTRPVISVQLTL